MKENTSVEPRETLVNEEESYQLPLEDILSRLDVNPDKGLTQAEAEQRLKKFGYNELEEEAKEPLWKKFLYQFKDTMVLILIAASILSMFQGDFWSSLIILAIVLINAILGVVQEGKAEAAIDALQKMSAPHSRAMREGRQMLLETRELVPGDILYLEAGDIVPADLRILTSSNLKADEAALTGESVAVEKSADFVSPDKLPLGDRKNLLYSGTSVTYGRATAVVIKTAHDTVLGQIATSLTSIEKEETPLQKNLNHLGNILGLVCVAISVIVFVTGLIQGGEPLELLMTAVSLAVAAIPEGLPAVVTIVLALGMNRMAKKHAIVKRLMAVETLGSVDIICSDKTGTLTQNEMTVQKLYTEDKMYDVTGIGYDPQGEIKLLGCVDINNGDLNLTRVDREKGKGYELLMTVASLCNDAKLQKTDDGYRVLGDPTEGALVTLSEKAGFHRNVLDDRLTFIDDLPFDSERKMMTVFYDGFDNGVKSLTKGAPDILLNHCHYEVIDNGDKLEVVELTLERRKEIMRINSMLAKKALRVLGFSYKDNPEKETAEQGMTFLGLVGMIDPARTEAKDAIAVCRQAGIRPVMITGDYKDTAEAIARDLGMVEPGDQFLDGMALDNMTDEELNSVVEHTRVYARVSPEHKLRIVRQLQNRQHTVSMTGDGVNDAPALKQADIGVAMGITGTEVAKDSAEMILTDDNFATIVSAVEEGRIIYSNIRKFVSFLLSCNVGEILVIFLTTMMLGPSYTPLLPIQLLWLNLVTDSFPALALGKEAGEKHIMHRPPRNPNDRIINKEMVWSIVVQSIAIFVSVFAAFQIGRYLYPDVLLDAADNVIKTAAHYDFYALPGYTPSAGARTFAFITLISAELLRAYSSRSERQSVFALGFFSNPTMNKAVLLSLVLMILVVYIPALDHIFYTIAPTFVDWLIIIALALIPFGAGELFKLFYHHRDKD